MLSLKTTVTKCWFCWYKHETKKEKYPAFGKTCDNCLKKIYFQAVCRIKKKNMERIEWKKQNGTNFGFFFLKNKEKIFTKILNKQHRFGYENEHSELTLIPINFWEHIGKSKLYENHVQLHQFDGSLIKTLGYFDGSL